MPRGLNPLICNEIERTGIIPEECRFLNESLHFCPDWGGALIDSSDPEFDRCQCKGNYGDGANHADHR